jgi:hypothetical protein
LSDVLLSDVHLTAAMSTRPSVTLHPNPTHTQKKRISNGQRRYTFNSAVTNTS